MRISLRRLRLCWRRLQALSRGSSLFRGLGGGRFERISDEADVWDTSWSWGCVFVDADLDGRPDIFVVNGMVTGKNETDHERADKALKGIVGKRLTYRRTDKLAA